MFKDYNIKVQDNLWLKGVIWEKEEVLKKAVVIICHGMAEHIMRYDNFGSFLADNGYIVIGYDQRGHGRTIVSPDDIGYMSDVNHFNTLIEDLKIVTTEVKNNYNLPIFILGHSMGSFISQRFSQLYGELVDGIIFSGTSLNKGLMINIGHILSKFIVRSKGRRYRSGLIHKLSFESFNKKYNKNKNTEVDWLSRDKEVCENYVLDDMCGAIFPASYYMDLISGFKAIYKNINNTLPRLKVLIVSGTADPVGNYGKGPSNYYNKLLGVGLKDVEIRLYDQARHEILNETNKEEVYNDILNWLNRKS